MNNWQALMTNFFQAYQEQETCQTLQEATHHQNSKGRPKKQRPYRKYIRQIHCSDGDSTRHWGASAKNLNRNRNIGMNQG